VASTAPTPNRARQLELWRGTIRSGLGDAEGMRTHLERAVALATSQGRAPARCEALARLALEAARLGVATGQAELLELAERSALAVKEIAAVLPGHPLWAAQADAALADVALVRGDVPAAVAAAGSALQAFEQAANEDANLDIALPVARAMFAGGPPEVQDFVKGYLRVTLSRVAQGTLDESIRVRWLRGPVGRELVGLLGTFDDGASAARPEALDQPVVDDVDRRLLRLLTEGNTNAEMAEKVGLSAEAVGVQLAKLLARLGVSNRAEATTLAFKGFSR
jgi:ATP/maltotriose-dependent transcriptional regulator MalT